MRNTIRLTDFTIEKLQEIFQITDDLQEGKYKNFLRDKTVIMFFPASSIRTRVTFEKGIYLLGGQTIVFPPETLDKKENIEDVTGYLNNWADAVVIRHKNIEVLEEMSKYSEFSVINAMTDVNHPCEILSDLYALSKIRNDFRKDRYLFVGAKGNIGGAWKEAAEAFGLNFVQCCPSGYEMEGVSSKWELNQTTPEMDKLVLLSDIFGISLDELVGREFIVHENPIKYIELNAKMDTIINSKEPYRYEYKSKRMIRNLPFNLGRGLYKAKGVISIGVISCGIISVGILSCGVISIGLLALGILTIAVFAAGIISAGSIALGILAVGAFSVGYFSVGAMAIGVYSIGADAIAQRIAFGDAAAGHIAIGKTSARGTIEFLLKNHVSADEIRSSIQKEYPG